MQDELDLVVRTGDHVHAHQLAYARGSGGTGISGRLHGANVTANHHGHEAGADLLLADQGHVGGFDHRVGRFDGAHEALGLDHAESGHSYISHGSAPSSCGLWLFVGFLPGVLCLRGRPGI